MTSEVILSICIPTFNRGVHLERCLQSIVKQAGNNEQVEIVISDNASDDGTKLIAEAYAGKFNNVKYFRNEANIGGNKNIIKVLELGNGKYLKLLNDYAEFVDGGLMKLLEIVTVHASQKEVLFFPNGVSYLKRKDFHYTDGLDEFLKVSSFWSTWIGSIGFWREDFYQLMKTYTFKTISFTQTELLFESVIIKKKAVTYSRQLVIAHEVINKTTGYNFFELFINTYLYQLIAGLKAEKKISSRAFRYEKNKFFTDFVFFWYKKIRIKNNHSTDVTGEGVEKLIFKGFKYSTIFYLYLLYLPFYLLGFYFKKLTK